MDFIILTWKNTTGPYRRMHIRETGCSIRGSTGNSPWSPPFPYLPYFPIYNKIFFLHQTRHADYYHRYYNLTIYPRSANHQRLTCLPMTHSCTGTLRKTGILPKYKKIWTALEDWDSKWQMSFYPEKCTVLRITTNKRYCRETNYFLHGQRLQVADSAKYLGETFSDDLQWEKHTQATAAKASRTLGFLRRNLKDCSKQVRSTTYKPMVRPTMKYASSSWDPNKTDDADYLDKVQRRAARYACMCHSNG